MSRMDKVDRNWLFAVSSNAKTEDHQMKLVGAKFKITKKRAAGTPRQRALQMMQVSVASREGWVYSHRGELPRDHI